MDFATLVTIVGVLVGVAVVIYGMLRAIAKGVTKGEMALGCVALAVVLVVVLLARFLTAPGGLLAARPQTKPTPTATELPTATPSPTGTPSPTYTPPAGATLFLHDPLKDNSQGHGWDTSSDPGGSCDFAHGGYDVNVPTNQGDVCLYYTPPLPPDNLAIEVTATLIAGLSTNDSGVALAFRADPTTGAEYEFGWDANGTGTFEIVDAHGNLTAVPGTGYPFAYFKQGYGPANANVIAVEAQGSHIRLFVNGYLYGELTDRTYTSGSMGFVVGAGSKGPAEAVFSNLTIWALP
jgi:hypothetical protein